jgi:hypothetical protein
MVIDALVPVKLDPSQYFIKTEFQSENPGLVWGSEAMKKRPARALQHTLAPA